ncbi:uncharacterized protein VP01_5512g1, partial [Puccinia sorghi]
PICIVFSVSGFHQQVQSKMTRDNVESQITKMGGFAKKLNSLITTPYSGQCLFHCPSDIPPTRLDQLCVVAHEQRTSSLLPYSLCLKTGFTQAKISLGRNHPNLCLNFCLFCKRSGHDLLNCNNASHPLPSRGSSSSRSKGPAKAGHTTVVELGDYTPDKDSFSEFLEEYEESARTVTASMAVSHPPNTRHVNLDLGCSLTMTPYKSTVSTLTPPATPVQLADNLLVKSSHTGTLQLPLAIPTSVKSLPTYTS